MVLLIQPPSMESCDGATHVDLLPYLCCNFQMDSHYTILSSTISIETIAGLFQSTFAMRLSTIFVYMCFTLTSAYPVSSAHSHPSHAVDVSSRGLFSTAMKKVGKCFSGDASVRQHSSASSHRTTTLSFHQDHSVSSPGRGSSPSMHGSSSTSTPSLAASPERDPLHEAAKGRIRQQIPGANAPLISSTSESPKNIRWMKQLNLRPTSKPYKFDSSSTSPSSATSTTSYQASPSKGKETLLGSASRTSSGGSSSGGGLFNVPGPSGIK